MSHKEESTLLGRPPSRLGDLKAEWEESGSRQPPSEAWLPTHSWETGHRCEKWSPPASRSEAQGRSLQPGSRKVRGPNRCFPTDQLPCPPWGHQSAGFPHLSWPGPPVCHMHIRIHTIPACTEILKVTQPEPGKGHIIRCLGPSTDPPSRAGHKCTGIQMGRCKQ